MRCIRSRDTTPELIVRSALRQIGYSGYRLHRRDLPGSPDVAYIGRKKAIFVHGCFWHSHDCPEGLRKPKSNEAYWLAKIERNRLRDQQVVSSLESMGWSVMVLWECEVRRHDWLDSRLREFMRA